MEICNPQDDVLPLIFISQSPSGGAEVDHDGFGLSENVSVKEPQE